MRTTLTLADDLLAQAQQISGLTGDSLDLDKDRLNWRIL